MVLFGTMSGNAAHLPCPICSHVGVFKTVESLRDKLIHVSTNIVTCPVCQEELCGLDKLTVHLFSHVNLSSARSETETKSTKNKISSSESGICVSFDKKIIPSVSSKNRTPQTKGSNTTIKYVKIRPKISLDTNNAVPVLSTPQTFVTEENATILNSDLSIASNKSTPNCETKNECNVCGLKFAESKILEVHKSLIHNDKDNSDYSMQNKYHCHLCSKKFKMRGSLMVHLRVAHFGFLSCDRETNSNNYLENKNMSKVNDDKVNNFERNDNKQWQCDVCHKHFTTKYFLKKHKRLHTGETPYACAQCNKTFTFQQSYHKHLLYHNDEKPHSCGHCGRAFKELSTLHNHQRIHTGEKPFSCETCGKCFRQRVSYLVHRRIHTGVMPYKCTACQKSFRYKVSQRTHKCLAQPPGTVVRQSGDLVEKLRRKQSTMDDVQTSSVPETELNPCTKFTEVSESNVELVRSGAKLSLEDMESEHFRLIPDCLNDQHSRQLDFETVLPSAIKSNDKVFDDNIEHLIDSFQDDDRSLPSPSDILQNLCLSKENR